MTRLPRAGLLAALLLGAWLGGTSVLVAEVASSEDCLDCHDADPALASSAHDFLECADCHAGVDLDLHPDETPAPACSDCHEDEVDTLLASVHGESLPDGSRLDCSSCHGPIHGVKPASDPQSATYPARLPETCASCHSDPKMAELFPFRRVVPLESYAASVHARAVREGRDGATCSSCHGAHDIRSTEAPDSKVSRQMQPQTCGACHGEVARTYEASIHGQAVAHGVDEAPVCTDCHGEHRILSPSQPGSPVYATNIPKLTCGRCHASLQVVEKFELPTDAVSAYEDSYHGLASRAGSTTVANCASCHGIHDILPASDPRSHIAPANLAETCGQCHPGAGQRFAVGPVHVAAVAEEHPAVFWARRIYLWLIALTIGGMLLHNGADLVRKILSPPQRPAPGAVGRQRMSGVMRLTHGLLALSFLVLVYTGFALKYPEAVWAQPILAWEDGSDLRSIVHRLAAVVMLGAGVLHIVHLIVSAEARACVRAMRPNLEDVHELVERVRYWLGRSSAPPRGPWIGYGEKMEYLAVVWGTLVMGLTGFVLWFENLTLSWAPKWVVDLATTIHFYEAVLASLAILVWHFYAVIFDPVVYPVDPAWLTGRSAPARDRERRAPSSR